MPPVNPRVSAVVSAKEKRELESIAKRLGFPVSWIVRQACKKVIGAKSEKTNELRNWLCD